MVYVPIAPARFGDDQLEVDLRETRDGRLALLAYSTREELMRCCGERQAWALMPTSGLERVRLETGFQLILLDLEIPQGWRHG